MDNLELHPCILPEDEYEYKKFQEEFGILDDAGDSWEDDAMSAFTELVVAQTPCADPTFMRMMDLLETEY